MDNKKTEFTRIFHPVGQGAFYSEKFVSTKEDGTLSECRIVYDCGSKHGVKWLGKRIANVFSDARVNLLFLSHFHDDHYKGIELLDPDIIVLPLLDEWDKAIFWLGHELKQTSFDKDYEDALRHRFPNAKIIRILPLNEGQPGEEVYTLSNEPLSSTQDIAHEEELPSGTILNLPAMKDWIYIPVNPKLDSEIIRKFQVLLDENPKIDKGELLKLDSEYFQIHKKRLSKIYEEIGKPNEYSMAVYSGPNRCSNIGGNIHVEGFFYQPSYYRSMYFGYFHPFPYHCKWLRMGCLYLGDINLKEDNGQPSHILKELYGSLPVCVAQDLSTIQVPHHGSKDNYNASLKTYYDRSAKEWRYWNRPMIYVISVGIRNSYGHPSPDVVADLMDNYCPVLLVTDDSDSTFIEKGHL